MKDITTDLVLYDGTSDDQYQYEKKVGDVIFEDGYSLALIRPVNNHEGYSIDFYLYTCTTWDINGNIEAISPYADIYLKWDGCSTWEYKNDHICGYDDLLRKQKIERWAFKTAHSMLKHGDKECAGLGDNT